MASTCFPAIFCETPPPKPETSAGDADGDQLDPRWTTHTHTQACRTGSKVLPQGWVLDDAHYSLDSVHCDAFLETAETCGRRETT